MSDYLRPEYTPLFTQVQDFIADQLNTDPQLSALGIEFLPEHRLDIEYEIKNNLGKQGTVGIVNTLKGTYGGHNGSTNAWEIEAEVDVLENPPVRRAQMKKMGLSAGSTADILDWVQESLCAPSSPTYGKFCAVSQELGEDRGIIVGRSIMKTFAIADISAVVSGEHQWVCPYALQSDLSALSVQVADITADIHGDYIEDADGNKIEADRTVEKEVICPWIMANGAGTQYTFVWNAETQLWEVGNLRIGFIEGVWKYGIKAGANINWIKTNESPEDTLMLTFSMMSGSREAVSKKEVVGTLAMESDIPTKTSDLTNDSGFITAAQVPTPDKIEDLSANVIYANRTVQYIEEVANWTDEYWPDYPLNWDAENNCWRADPSPSFYMTLKYNSGTWTLEFNENIGGEWVVDSASV